MIWKWKNLMWSYDIEEHAFLDDLRKKLDMSEDDLGDVMADEIDYAEDFRILVRIVEKSETEDKEIEICQGGRKDGDLGNDDDRVNEVGSYRDRPSNIMEVNSRAYHLNELGISVIGGKPVWIF